MSADTSDHELRRGFLEQFELRYEETRNPLYVWTAIDLCLSGSNDLPLPPWCIEYLRSVSENISRLTRGFDCRQLAGRAERISATEAVELVPDALHMPRKKGKKNPFLQMATDAEDVRLASSLLSGYPDLAHRPSRNATVTQVTIGPSGEIVKTATVNAETDLNGKMASPETVRRRTNRGARLLGLSSKLDDKF